MKDCIFCKIARKEIPADIFYEDENCVAFLDIEPVNLGHTLIVTKKHFDDISELQKKDLDGLNSAVLKISKAILKVSEGLNVMQNNKKSAGQEVPHYHVHLIPRYSGDGHKFDWAKENISKEENQKFINKIKSFLK